MKNKVSQLTIRKKLTLVFALIVVTMIIVEVMVCMKMNQSIDEIDAVYATNVENNELLDNLNLIQQYIYEYLNIRSTDSLENFYRYESKYQNLIQELNDKASEDEVAMLEKNIREMSQSYLSTLEDTIQAKRGRNIEKYKEGYEKASKLYRFISDYIEASNEKHFRKNSTNYSQLVEDLHNLEIASVYILLGWAAVCIYMIYIITGNITGPLTQLAKTLNRVSADNLNIQIPHVKNHDEVGIVSKAVDTMMESIRQYITQIQENKEKEQKMLEQELLMENYVKDAQLKYLQAQINPHFLYNSINAGVQLAMMEGAEQTSVFLEKMADFFRYNVRKMKEEATLFEEIEAVDNYIYIINVRFEGDIHFTKEVDTNVKNISIPSMILQPIVENCVNHGLQDVEWERRIRLKVQYQENHLIIQIEDNGKGMTPEQIEQIQKGEKEQTSQKDSTGVGLDNVKKRLELYYERSGLMEIQSAGEGKGTKVIITVEEKGN